MRDEWRNQMEAGRLLRALAKVEPPVAMSERVLERLRQAEAEGRARTFAPWQIWVPATVGVTILGVLLAAPRSATDRSVARGNGASFPVPRALMANPAPERGSAMGRVGPDSKAVPANLIAGVRANALGKNQARRGPERSSEFGSELRTEGKQEVIPEQPLLTVASIEEPAAAPGSALPERPGDALPSMQAASALGRPLPKLTGAVSPGQPLTRFQIAAAPGNALPTFAEATQKEEDR